MADNDNISLNIQVDMNHLEDELAKLSTGLGILKTIGDNILNAITRGFDCNIQAIGDVDTQCTNIINTMDDTAKKLSGTIDKSSTGIIDEIKNIFNSVEAANKAQEVDSGFNVASKSVDWVLQAMGLAVSMGNAKTSSTTDKSNEKDGEITKSLIGWLQGTSSTTLALPAAGESSYGKTKEDSASGIVSGGLMDLGVSFPDVESMDALAESVGNVASRIKESAAAWGQELAAKAASKAEDLRIIVINTVEHVKAFGMMIGQLVASAAAWAGETAAKVANTAAQWAQNAATTAWQAICTAATAVTTAFGAAVSFLTSPIGFVIIAITALIAIVVLLVKNWDTVKTVVLSAWDAIVGALGSAWEWFKTKVLDPIINGFKSAVNGVIGFINGLIAGAVDGINAVIGLLNKLQFTVPDWVPGLGGMTLGFNLKLLSAPQIPYLAQGAVLPANKPFLAVVGDQKHGTNVEAPLSTIQEAVAVVMGDQIAAMMAGFEALLKEQRATRQTIEGIEIGDTVIGRAAERYGRKMAVARGGY